jgi:hypothetical protein
MNENLVVAKACIDRRHKARPYALYHGEGGVGPGRGPSRLLGLPRHSLKPRSNHAQTMPQIKFARAIRSLIRVPDVPVSAP